MMLPSRRSLKLLAYRTAQISGVVPSVWMMRNPFKIHEYYEVISGAALDPKHSVLDLGCGKGFQTQLIARRCSNAVGVDVSEVQIAEARRFLKHSVVENKVKFFCGPVEEAHLTASSVDRVISFCVLEHISNLNQVLAELVRVLKPGGELHASVDALLNIKDQALLARHRSEHHVVQYFTPSSLREQLEAAGFEVTKIFPIMTSEFARKQFEARIQRDDFSHSLVDRVRFHRRLRAGDRVSESQEGIMLVVRARRP